MEQLKDKFNFLGKGPLAAGVVVLILAVFLVATSLISVGENKIMLLNRVMGGEAMGKGEVIALPDENGNERKGPQARYLRSGVQWVTFGRIIYDMQEKDLLVVPTNKVAVLTAKDGKFLPKGAFTAPEWKYDAEKMLHPSFFLDEGEGYRGLQYNVLTPASYPVNPYLWDVKMYPASEVPAGFVGVVRSRVSTIEGCPGDDEVMGDESTSTEIDTLVVPKGCKGIWDTPLTEGAFYLNPMVNDVSLITKRTVVWEYKGGYKRRSIKLKIDKNGEITQTESEDETELEVGDAGEAIFVRTPDGWNVPVEVRVQAQVHPKNAAIVYSSVGGLDEAENNIVTSALRDKLRTIAGEEGFKAKDLITKREAIGKQIQEAVVEQAERVGVSITAVYLAEIALPPELMLPDRRRQLADGMKQSYNTEKEAEQARVEREKVSAEANSQADLIKAEIAKKAAADWAEEARIQGQGERDRLIEISKGQAAQADVLGKETTAMLQLGLKALEVAEKNPDTVKVPLINVQGAAGLEGAASILGGSSNLAEMMRLQSETDKKKSGK